MLNGHGVHHPFMLHKKSLATLLSSRDVQSVCLVYFGIVHIFPLLSYFRSKYTHRTSGIQQGGWPHTMFASTSRHVTLSRHISASRTMAPHPALVSTILHKGAADPSERKPSLAHRNIQNRFSVIRAGSGRLGRFQPYQPPLTSHPLTSHP